MAFLAAAFAVAMALGPLAVSLAEHSSGEIAFTIGELLAILFILFLVFRRIAQRSESMAERLAERLAEQLKKVQSLQQFPVVGVGSAYLA